MNLNTYLGTLANKGGVEIKRHLVISPERKMDGKKHDDGR